MTISRWSLLRIRNILNKICTESQNTYYVQYLFFPRKGAVFEITQKNLVEPERPQMTIRRRVACWIRPNARKHKPAPMHPHPHTRAHAHTHTHTQVCFSFPQQQFSHKRASVLLACLVKPHEENRSCGGRVSQSHSLRLNVGALFYLTTRITLHWHRFALQRSSRCCCNFRDPRYKEFFVFLIIFE